jgi:hypothetical protein
MLHNHRIVTICTNNHNIQTHSSPDWNNSLHCTMRAFQFQRSCISTRSLGCAIRLDGSVLPNLAASSTNIITYIVVYVDVHVNYSQQKK